MKPAKLTFSARCSSCNAPKVVPTRDAEDAFASSGKATYSYLCRCGAFVTEAVVADEKKRPDPKPRKPLERSGGLERKGNGLKRKRKPRRSDLARRLSERWASEVRGRPCAACGRMTDYPRAIVVEGHHIVRQALLKARGAALEWTEEELTRRLWDTRNRLPLCGDCHRRHHSKMKKLSWKLVRDHAPKVEQFARETGLMGEARRDYG